MALKIFNENSKIKFVLLLACISANDYKKKVLGLYESLHRFFNTFLHFEIL